MCLIKMGQIGILKTAVYSEVKPIARPHNDRTVGEVNFH